MKKGKTANGSVRHVHFSEDNMDDVVNQEHKLLRELINSAQDGNITNIESFLSSEGGGVDLNLPLQDNNMRTILHEAVINDVNPEIINLLIANGANLEIRDRDGRTALISAFLDQNQAMVLHLLGQGADIEQIRPGALDRNVEDLTTLANNPHIYDFLVDTGILTPLTSDELDQMQLIRLQSSGITLNVAQLVSTRTPENTNESDVHDLMMSGRHNDDRAFYDYGIKCCTIS